MTQHNDCTAYDYPLPKKFSLAVIEYIETNGNNDLVIGLKDETSYTFRCSCCVVFEKDRIVVS